MRAALDTKLLAYAEGVNDAHKRASVLALIRELPPDAIVIPVQALGELFNVLVRKARRTRREARDAVLAWRDAFAIAETSTEIMLAATDLAADHQMSIWDAVMLCAASQSGCRVLLSEELQHGFTWTGVTIIDPFAYPDHPLMVALMDGNDRN
ncbi:MAG: PIN domain-containing protein [Burkholderiaceae bacterium]